MAVEMGSAVPASVEGIGIILQQLEKQVPVFTLVMARVFGMFMQTPFFSTKVVPPQVRATLVVSLTMMYMITMQPKVPNLPTNLITLAIMIIQEALIGMAFGFCASIVVSAIQAAGELIDVQMGLSMVTLFNPATKSQSSAMGRLFYQIEGMVFILAHGHIYLLSLFFTTFTMVPIGGFNFSHTLVITTFINIVGKLFYIAAKLALPLLIVLFILDFSLGITNKVSPQINVLELMTALKPTVGMLILLILASTLVAVISEYKIEILKDAMTIIKAMQRVQ